MSVSHYRSKVESINTDYNKIGNLHRIVTVTSKQNLETLSRGRYVYASDGDPNDTLVLSDLHTTNSYTVFGMTGVATIHFTMRFSVFF